MRDSGKNIVSRCKKSEGIKIGLSLEESGPFVSVVSHPVLLRVVVREIELEIKASVAAELNNLMVLFHQQFRRWSLGWWWNKSEQGYNVEDVAVRNHYRVSTIPPDKHKTKTKVEAINELG